jgi:hypothetical protein
MSVITLNFEGYVQCRLATDPDPTDERRGVSGYTFALPGEKDLDWTIYTQPGPDVVTRPGLVTPPGAVTPSGVKLAAGSPDRQVGVRVCGGFCGDQPIVKGHPLFNATVHLEDKPRFEERNYVVINQQFGVIAPFKLRVKGVGIELYRQVDWYPGKSQDFPLMKIPQAILMPYTMQSFSAGLAACAGLLGESRDPSVYRTLRLKKLMDIKRTSRLTQDALAAIDKRVEQLHIDNPGDRRTFQLVNAANYTYAVNGPASIKLGDVTTWLNGAVDTESQWNYFLPNRPLQPWPCNFWIGNWDADSLTCYMSGTVQYFGLGKNFEQWQAKPLT